MCRNIILGAGLTIILGVSMMSLVYSLVYFHKPEPISIWLMCSSVVNIVFVGVIYCVYVSVSNKLLKFCCMLFVGWLICNDTVGILYLIRKTKIDIMGIVVAVCQVLYIPFMVVIIRLTDLVE